MKGFKRREAEGKSAAKEFALNLRLFLDMEALSIRDIQDEGIEGCDYDTVKICWRRTRLDADTKALLSEIGQAASDECLVAELVHGGVEVKSMQPNQSLHRDDLQDLQSICLPFGIFAGTKMNQKGITVSSRNSHGWLRRLCEPRWKPSSSAEPMVLEYMLECWDNRGGKRPFASIAFTDLPELKHLLVMYGKENGLDITNWSSIPIGKDAADFICEDLIIKGNVW